MESVDYDNYFTIFSSEGESKCLPPGIVHERRFGE
jgi:hypothetical protein